MGLLGCTTTARAEPPATQPVGIVTNSDTDALLDALHQRGQTLSSLSANVTKADVDASLGDETSQRIGSVRLQKQADGDTRIHVDLPQKREAGKLKNDRVE
jgi:hypothetical protein